MDVGSVSPTTCNRNFNGILKKMRQILKNVKVVLFKWEHLDELSNLRFARSGTVHCTV